MSDSHATGSRAATLVDLVSRNLLSLKPANNETVRRCLTTLLNQVDQAERDRRRNARRDV